MAAAAEKTSRWGANAGLLLALAGLATFALVATDVVAHGRLAQVDEILAGDLSQHAREHPVLLDVFRVITLTGNKIVLAGVVLVMGISFCLNRQHRLAVFLAIALLGGVILEWLLKFVFHRPRPFLPEQVPGWSFPSGHAMTALLGYGLLGYFLVIRRRSSSFWFLIGLGLLVLAIGFSRMYLQAHYLTDVIGGFAVALCWLMIWISAMERDRGGHTGASDPTRPQSPAT